LPEQEESGKGRRANQRETFALGLDKAGKEGEISKRGNIRRDGEKKDEYKISRKNRRFNIGEKKKRKLETSSENETTRTLL